MGGPLGEVRLERVVESGMTDPYATPEPLPYDPENPEVLPYDALPPPERVYLTAQEAIDAAAEAPHIELQQAVPDEPPMVTAYKEQMANGQPSA